MTAPTQLYGAFPHSSKFTGDLPVGRGWLVGRLSKNASEQRCVIIPDVSVKSPGCVSLVEEKGTLVEKDGAFVAQTCKTWDGRRNNSANLYVKLGSDKKEYTLAHMVHAFVGSKNMDLAQVRDYVIFGAIFGANSIT